MGFCLFIRASFIATLALQFQPNTQYINDDIYHDEQGNPDDIAFASIHNRDHNTLHIM